MRSAPLQVGDTVSGLVVDRWESASVPNKRSRTYTLRCPVCDWSVTTNQIGNIKRKKQACDGCRPEKYTGIHIVEWNFWAKIKYGAKWRGIEFDLTFEQFMEMLSNQCHYCGGEGQERWNKQKTEFAVYCGFDRVDSSRGYVVDNLVPCCYACNKAKGTMRYDEFIRWLDNLVAFRKGD